MAIQYIKLNEESITRIYNSPEIKGFTTQMYKDLGIKNDNYEIKIEKVAYDKDGFTKEDTKGRIRYDENCSQIVGVNYYTQSLADSINNRFSKLCYDQNIVERIACIIIKLAIAHEMRHVWQFENQKITKDIIEKEKVKPYSERSYEQDAIEYSERVIARMGEYEEKILRVVQGKDSVSNDNIRNYIE